MSHKLKDINNRINELQCFLEKQDLQISENNVPTALKKLMELKMILGNTNNDIHFLTLYLANAFLKQKHKVEINLGKPSGSAGLDIDTNEIIGEIKTTVPYLENDFGAKQKENIRKDLERLEDTPAKYKYFFVIDDKTEKILKRKYAKDYPSVQIVNLL